MARRIPKLRPKEVTAREEAVAKGLPPPVPACLTVPPNVKRKMLRKFMRQIDGGLKSFLLRQRTSMPINWVTEIDLPALKIQNWDHRRGKLPLHARSRWVHFVSVEEIEPWVREGLLEWRQLEHHAPSQNHGNHGDRSLEPTAETSGSTRLMGSSMARYNSTRRH